MLPYQQGATNLGSGSVEFYGIWRLMVKFFAHITPLRDRGWVVSGPLPPSGTTVTLGCDREIRPPQTVATGATGDLDL
jgi:hypothetical protein